MRNVLTIAGKEVRSTFVTPTAYVIIAGFLLISGFFFFTLLQQFNGLLAQAAMMPELSPNLNEWVVIPFFQTLEVVLIFLIPILTMRAVAEERRSGTFELLATSPLSANEIILGKYLGLLVTVFVMLALSFSFPLILIVFADPEVAPIYVGFLGILLFAAAFVSMGLAISCFTKSQTVSGVLSLVLLLVFYVIDAPAEKIGGVAADILRYLAPSNHIETLLKGVLTGGDIVYFISLLLFGLFVANRTLDAENWR
jgi:ABC-2 type transport system permease protein